MNLLEKMNLLFRLNSFINAEIKEAQIMNGSKPGWKTTEFWLNIASQIGLLWGTYSHFIPPQYAVPISIGGVAIYTVARTVAKAVSDIQAAKTSVTTVTTTAPATTITAPAPS